MSIRQGLFFVFDFFELRIHHIVGGSIGRLLRTPSIGRAGIGTDTYTPDRWYYVVEHAFWSRKWIADLPHDDLAAVNADAGR